LHVHDTWFSLLGMHRVKEKYFMINLVWLIVELPHVYIYVQWKISYLAHDRPFILQFRANTIRRDLDPLHWKFSQVFSIFNLHHWNTTTTFHYNLILTFSLMIDGWDSTWENLREFSMERILIPLGDLIETIICTNQLKIVFTFSS